MNRKIFIVSGGSPVEQGFFSRQLKTSWEHLIICCDGGLRHLLKFKITPDVIIGDMDSIRPDQLKKHSNPGTKIIRFVINKDFTDTELALDYAMRLKPEKIFIWCALGGRIDHTLANIFLLVKGRKKGIDTCLMDEYCEAFLLDKETTFINEKGKTVSLLALTPKVTGLTLSGFAYPLQKGSLQMGESRGISNMIRGPRAKIKVEKGKLLVVKYHQNNVFPEAR